jgi:hypothetical protein
MLRFDPATLDLPAVLAQFERHGWARLGCWADDATLEGLRQRLDDIVLGRLPHGEFFFQHDAESGQYEDLTYGKGWQGPSPDYRKIEKLERDPLFRAWITNPLFERVARALIPGPISLYRAVVFSKGARGGSELPWHQDGGDFWGVDRNPFLQVWTALDDAPRSAGCVEVLSGTHVDGLASRDGGVIPAPMVEAALARQEVLPLPARAGEVLLIHNHVWHRSQRNRTGLPRRALTTCLMTSETRCRRKKRAPREFVRVFP